MINGELFPNMSEVDFRFDAILKDEHPFIIGQPHFSRPGILTGADKTPNFELTEIQAHIPSGVTIPESGAGENSGIFEPFTPDILCRFIAKIAHGAAVAEFGIDTF